jgi:class 3 adenylate cyclase/tetratricopeptide (TPR) repeat protein
VQRRTNDGERKRVTALFADVKGSTAAIEGLDPEAALNQLDPALQIMTRLVQRYGGVVCRRLGDGIFALFGAPVAHEDHAVQACFAALGMQRELRGIGAGEMVRVGLNSGDVLYRTIVSELGIEVDVAGLAVHIAARMEQIALAGSVYLTGETYALTRGLIETRLVGARHVKGASAPIEVYEATHASPFRSRWRASGVRERAPFVGREAERSVLDDALSALGNGRGTAVGIAAEAGLGKSRLVRRVVDEVGPGGSTHRTVHADATAFGGDVAYHTIVSALRDLFGISEADAAAHAAGTVTAALDQIDPSLVREADILSSLISPASAKQDWLTMDPRRKRRAVLNACVKLARTLAQQAPTVFVFEDTHWIDRHSEEILRAIVTLTCQERILVILTYRPYYDDAWIAEAGGTSLRMSALADGDVRQLLRQWFVEGTETERLIERLVATVGGNPLFVEESLRALLQRGGLIAVADDEGRSPRRRFAVEGTVDDIDLPPSVQDVIASRIDRRSPDCVTLLHILSTVSRRIPQWLVERVSTGPPDSTETALQEALSAEILVTASLSPDLEYAFSHAILREVAHDTLTRTRRVEIHRRVFAAISEHYRGRSEEQAEWLAHHAAGGELWEDAAWHQGRAAERALARGSYGEAIAGMRTAVSFYDRSSGSVPATEHAIDHLLRLRRVLASIGTVAHETVPLIDRAEQLARKIGDRLRLGWVLNERSGELWVAGMNREAVAAARRSAEIGRETGDVRLQASALQRLGVSLQALGNWEESANVLKECCALLTGDLRYERIASVFPTFVLAGGLLVTSFACLGNFEDADRYVAEISAFANQTKDALAVASAHLARCSIAIERKDVTGLLPLLERFYTAAKAGGALQVVQFIKVQFGRCRLLAGDAAGAVELLNPAAEPENMRQSYIYRLGIVAYADALASEGALNRAQNQLDDIEGDLTTRGEKGTLAYCWAVRGKIALAAGDYGNAEAAYRRALTQGEALSWQPFARVCEVALDGIRAASAEL